MIPREKRRVMIEEPRQIKMAKEYLLQVKCRYSADINEGLHPNLDAMPR
jgi:hypothetical protein